LHGKLLLKLGWHKWRAGETHSLNTAYYAEFRSVGPELILCNVTPFAPTYRL